MSRIYSLQYQAMKKDIDKYFEENKEEVNKSFLNRGCRITVKVDRLECYHSNSIPMNLEDFSNRYYEPKGKLSSETGISGIHGRVTWDNLIVNADYSTTRDTYLETKVEIYLDVYKKEQPRLGEVGSYSIFNNLGGAKRIIFHLDIPKSTYDFLDKAKSSCDGLELNVKVEPPNFEEDKFVLPIGHQDDANGKVYRASFDTLHSFGKKTN